MPTPKLGSWIVIAMGALGALCIASTAEAQSTSALDAVK